MKDWQKSAIEEGIASAERGELTPLDQVKAKWENLGTALAVTGTLPDGVIARLESCCYPSDVPSRYIRMMACEIRLTRAFIADFSRAMAADKAEIERFKAENNLLKLAAEFDSAPEDTEWEPPHPIFVMALARDQLRAELAEVRKDAERYRWLREVDWIDEEILSWFKIEPDCPITLDRAIDAAIYAQQENKDA